MHLAVLCVPTEQVLLERDIAALLNLLHNFSDKWNEIGLGLGFTPSELKQISGNPSLFMSAPASFLRELLSQWIQWPTKDHSKQPTLGVLCETLRSSLVGLGSLADRVEREVEYSTTGKGSFAVHIAWYLNHDNWDGPGQGSSGEAFFSYTRSPYYSINANAWFIWYLWG